MGVGAKSERREPSTAEARRAAAKNATKVPSRRPQRKSTFLHLPHRVGGRGWFLELPLDTSVFASLISILDAVKFNDTVEKSPRGEASHACHFLRR